MHCPLIDSSAGDCRERTKAGPEMHVLCRSPCRDLQFEIRPPAGFVQAEDRNQQCTGPYEKELQHFVEDRGAKSTEGHINGDGQRGNPDAEINVPPSTIFMTLAMANMLTPLMSTVMNANEIADKARLGSPKRNFKYPGTEWVLEM